MTQRSPDKPSTRTARQQAEAEQRAKRGARTRSDRARQKRKRLGKPTKAHWDVALAEALVRVVREKGMLKPSGALRRSGVAAHPDLALALSYATEELKVVRDPKTGQARFSPAQIAATMPARLAPRAPVAAESPVHTNEPSAPLVAVEE